MNEIVRHELTDMNSSTFKTVRKGLGAAAISMFIIGAVEHNPQSMINGVIMGAIAGSQEASARIQHNREAGTAAEASIEAQQTNAATEH